MDEIESYKLQIKTQEGFIVQYLLQIEIAKTTIYSYNQMIKDAKKRNKRK